MTDDRKDRDPKRSNWRGGTILGETEADGHMLPESESDAARMKSEGDEDAVAHPRVIPPPD